MLRWTQTIIAAAFVLLLGVWTWYFLGSSSDEATRRRLEEAQRKVESLERDYTQLKQTHDALRQSYEQLRQTYNEAVAKTAVTELVVEDGTLCVTIRTAEGVDRTIPTPFDPSKEI